jgi:hypothetical protein
MRRIAMRPLLTAVMLAAMAVGLCACIVEPAPGPYRYGYHWVPGHYGPYGGWVPGHWAA